MDAVILAAGRNRRLGDLVPEFYKPLIRRDNALSLVHNAVRIACEHGIERPVVVASPTNALSIHHELADEPADIVIQRFPNGPGDALRYGLALNLGTPSDRVLVLLADNTLIYDDVAAVCATDGIGVCWLKPDEAERFTWYDEDERRWREKEPVPNRLPNVSCWVGPFVGERARMVHVLSHALPINGEYLIGPHLGDLTNDGEQVYVSSRDVGTEESYISYIRGELP